MSKINKKELAICRRRGHVAYVTDGGWIQCTACGLWLREVRKIEEREDAPPESERDTMQKLVDMQKRTKDRTAKWTQK
jgi:ribosomal protein L37E